MAQRDFSKGPVWRIIVAQAIPLTVAQLVQLLYNVVDRIYIGHMDGSSSLALTGVGLAFPIITLITAFAALFGMGGVPLFSIARGAGEQEEAQRILGTSCGLLLLSSLVLMTVSLIFCRPLLFLFGASADSYAPAAAYLRVYLLGTPFSMLTSGLNGYINAQGFPRVGMLTTVLGAVINIALDPLFIYTFDMGVAGAALATVLSQLISAAWVLQFLSGRRALQRLERRYLRPQRDITRRILGLGTANFIMQATNFLVQIACNTTLQTFGGDVYVGIMTVINSIRGIFMLPVSGIFSGGQPVVSFNFGARQPERVRAAIRFNTWAGCIIALIAWGAILLMPRFWFSIFSSDATLVDMGVEALKMYFFGFVFMAFQFAGQSTFTALGDAKHAITFSLLRKAAIVVPLTLLLPRLGFGVHGVFLAEPASNVIGGLASYLTMRSTVKKKLQAMPARES